MAGLCPRLDESTGRELFHSCLPRASWLKTVLVRAARAAANKHDFHLWAQYLQLRAPRSPNKAVLPVAASMLTAAYHMVKSGVEHEDLGGSDSSATGSST